ncbi:MAG: double-strand break repair protein AddB [Rhodobacteraceae bacterium]|nr:double-strand break repair protein AddB [Paracoccaceae bacterium]
MFDPSERPRVFATPLGVDFTTALIKGLERRLSRHPPEALARVELYVSTARMQRRLTAQFAKRRASFLPRIRPITDVAHRPDMAELPPAMSPLRLRLRLSQLVLKLLDHQPDLAPRTAFYALADSLATLMGEMQEEGVTPADVHGLDVGEHATHWQRNQAFLSIIADFVAAEGAQGALTEQARHAAVVDRLARIWAKTPPAHPVIVAGSTGSRGTTARFMQVVAHLPQGAVVLPGLDYDMPAKIWQHLMDAPARDLAGEDHPQFRLGRMANRLGHAPWDVPRWCDGLEPPSPLRNRLLSLALRPAPVTDQWRREGPQLGALAPAVANMVLLEAPTPQAEAAAIALRLRKAAQTGQCAALVTPDRGLARQVTAALDRWEIIPDDSAGQPLSLTAPGRLLRHLAELLAEGRASSEALMVLLKHPLTHSARNDRGQHLSRTRNLELNLRHNGTPYPVRGDLIAWAGRRGNDPGAEAWAHWVADLLLVEPAGGAQPLAAHLTHHLALANALAHGGPQGQAQPVPSGGLWAREAGQAVARQMQRVQADADAGGELTAAEYRDFFAAILDEEEVRSLVRPHARIMIWGALEARVQGTDLMILAGLNEGVWPAASGAEPWLNRALRAQAGLRLPDSRIGLSAHDFQQAAAGKEVWLSRACQDAETQTVPSRWLNRLTNLMEGTGSESKAALKEMRKRGQDWLDMAARLGRPDRKVDPAPRPSPRPPVAKRPRQLSVTRIETLVRDPYAIYAREILGLRPLAPLRQAPDARLLGTEVHKILHRFVKNTSTRLSDGAEDLLRQLAAEELAAVPWPVARRLWQARMDRIAKWFVMTERTRLRHATPHRLECSAEYPIPGTGFTLSGTADRLDLTPDGALVIYDYKTGTLPDGKQKRHFTKQLWLLAMMARGGAFGGVRGVAHTAYISLRVGVEDKGHDVTPEDIDRIEDEFRRLLTHYGRDSSGYTSRRAMQDLPWEGDYDHLARYGEWDETTEPTPQDVGR